MTSFQTLLMSPRAAHPSRHRLDLALSRGLSEAEQEAVESHLFACPFCSERADEIRLEKTAFLLLPPPRNLCLEQEAPNQKILLLPRLPRLPRFFAGALVGIAASILAFVGISSILLAPPPPSDSGFRSKGAFEGQPQETPSLDVYLERQGHVTKAVSGGRYQEGDRLALAYKAAAVSFFALLLRDPKGEITWLYPDTEGPTIPLAAQGRLLGSIELDQAQGTETMVAFFSPYPLSASGLLRLAKEPPPPGWFRLSTSLLPRKEQKQGSWGFAWHFVLNKGR